MKKLFVRRTIEPIQRLLRTGVTPDKITLSITLGVVLGIFPVLGSTTILCTIAALALGLNLPAIQLVNYLVYPLQLVLLIPFYRGGEVLFRVEASLLSLDEVVGLIRANAWQALHVLWATTWHAVVVWLILSVIIIPALYYSLLPAVKALPLQEEVHHVS